MLLTQAALQATHRRTPAPYGMLAVLPTVRLCLAKFDKFEHLHLKEQLTKSWKENDKLCKKADAANKRQKQTSKRKMQQDFAWQNSFTLHGFKKHQLSFFFQSAAKSHIDLTFIHIDNCDQPPHCC